ncbi:MAG TPA: YlcI/YnfO family protein [Nitrosopumilaceae archaeon]|nr:YlcI/YnfO family protein [Nitrosopumilaceae archaeon]
MSRTVSSRIPKELHEELRERCNIIGCSINDFIEASIEFALTGHSEFGYLLIVDTTSSRYLTMRLA